MSDTSRRKFMAAAGVSAAAVGTVALTAGSAAAKSSTSATEAVLAVVEDPKGDTVTLLVGEREIVVRDRDLATRILNAAGGK